MLPEKTPAQHALARSGASAGVILLLLAGTIGLLTDSSFAGILAGAGLVMIVASFVLNRGD